MLSFTSRGQFPDMAILLNPPGSALTGGELVELKDSGSYSVSSFNSTIPTRRKSIQQIISGKRSQILEQMHAAGDDVFSLPVREVYYLVRGQHGAHHKICLTHGSFFETIPVNDLIQSAFQQILDERIANTGQPISDEVRAALIDLFNDQQSFSRVRHVDEAAVNIRFRVMTEVKKEGNILDTATYPDIKDDTLNLVLPCPDDNACEEHMAAAQLALGTAFDDCQTFRIMHRLNGPFLVFQHAL